MYINSSAQSTETHDQSTYMLSDSDHETSTCRCLCSPINYQHEQKSNTQLFHAQQDDYDEKSIMSTCRSTTISMPLSPDIDHSRLGMNNVTETTDINPNPPLDDKKPGTWSQR